MPDDLARQLSTCSYGPSAPEQCRRRINADLSDRGWAGFLRGMVAGGALCGVVLALVGCTPAPVRLDPPMCIIRDIGTGTIREAPCPRGAP